MKALLSVTATALIFFSVILSINVHEDLSILEEQVSEQGITFGAFRPSGYVGKLTTRLTEGGAEATFTTTPSTAPDGSTLTTAKIGDFAVITINPGASNEEKISVSAVSVSGTTATWTIINRGLSFTENGAVTANKKQHSIGEPIIISNDDHFLSQQYVDVDGFNVISGSKTITGGWTFSTLPTTTVACSSQYDFCNKSYIDAGLNQGAATSTFANLGLVELATVAESAAGTASSSAGGPLVPANSLFKQTWAAITQVPVTSSAGKLAQSLFDLTQHFNFTSLFATNASSTNATTTNLYVSGAISGNITATTTTFSTTGANTWTKPTNAKRVHVQLWGGGGSGASAGGGNEGACGGGGGAYVEAWFNASALGTTETVTIATGGATVSGALQDGNVGGNTTFGSLITAYGGGPGDAQAAACSGGAGGGGSISAGTISAAGSPGSPVAGTYAGNGQISGGGGGGNTYSGGGGGASARCGFSNGTAGTSVLGGAGGAGSSSGAATDGTQPAGGGGGACGSAASGDGGNGRAIITTYF